MRISRLQIKNFLSISDVEIKPGQINQIVGLNNNGKTSILKAIEVALTGSNDGALVKRGEDEAEIIVEFDDELTVRRRIGSDGKQNVVVKKGEFKADAPQTLLNSLLEGNGLNPLELLDPKKRTEALLKAIEIKVAEEDIRKAVGETPVDVPPLDYSQHGLKVAEQAHRYFYQRRAEANKIAKQKFDQYSVKASELPPKREDVNWPELATVALQEKREALKTEVRVELSKETDLNAAQERVKKLENDKELVVSYVMDTREEIAKLQTQLGESQRRIAVLDEQKVLALEYCEKLKPNVDLIGQVNAQIEELTKEIEARSADQTIKEKYSSCETLKASFESSQAFAEKLDKAVHSLGKEFKDYLMNKSELPVPGLTYENEQFFWEGSSIDNLSSSKSLKLAVALARKLSSKTKLICIDGCEALDESNYAEFAKEIADDGYTYFISKVGEPFKNTTDKVFHMHEGAVQ